jgi:glycogen operon protein
VSYEQKHNEANGEKNQDGANDNNSRNWGVEGETNDRSVLDARFRAMRNFMATLAFSQGVPMIAHGDELARTQKGNNNVYAQDNELSWMNWEELEHDERRVALLEFTRKVFAIRHLNPVLRRRTFFRGESVDRNGGVKDLTWLRADGQEMQQDDWSNGSAHALGMLIHGDATDETDDRGRPIRGDTMLLLLNAGEGPVRYALPAISGEGVWSELVNTAREEILPKEGTVELLPSSLVLLRYGRERRLAIAGGAAAANVSAVSSAGESTPNTSVPEQELIESEAAVVQA